MTEAGNAATYHHPGEQGPRRAYAGGRPGDHILSAADLNDPNHHVLLIRRQLTKQIKQRLFSIREPIVLHGGLCFFAQEFAGGDAEIVSQHLNLGHGRILASVDVRNKASPYTCFFTSNRRCLSLLFTKGFDVFNKNSRIQGGITPL